MEKKEIRVLALDLDGFSADRVALEEQYRDVSGQSLAAVIAERTGAYIEDKADELGLSVRAKVKTEEEDGVPLPVSVTLYGTENAALADYIERELGIAKEDQLWITTEAGASGP